MSDKFERSRCRGGKLILQPAAQTLLRHYCTDRLQMTSSALTEMAALFYGIFWLHFCTVRPSGHRLPMFIYVTSGLTSVFFTVITQRVTVTRHASIDHNLTSPKKRAVEVL